MKCRHCGEEFSPPKPPQKPFGRYVDECRECSTPKTAPAQPENKTLLKNRSALSAKLKKSGAKPSKIADVMGQIDEIEPF